MNTHPRIAIVGAGLGGLMLARVLQHSGQGIVGDVIVYEREPSASSRPQGGTLDIHTESGQRSLREAGLQEKIEPLLRYEGQDTRILDKDGVVHIDQDGSDQRDRPEIDRIALRNVLLESLHPGTVRWNHTLRKITPAQEAEGKFVLHFDDGSTASDFDLVVGADGTWSKVRSLVSPAAPSYSGLSMVEIRFASVDTKTPHVAKLVGRGSLLALSNKKGLIAQRNGDGSVRVYVSLFVPEQWVKECGIDFADTQQARELLLKEHFSDWSEDLRGLIRDCDSEFIPRALYALPVGHRWETRQGVTLVGDAAHVMTPFAGEGANLAMLDALELAQKILEKPHDLNTAVSEYEAVMFDRAGRAAKHTEDNIELCFREDAPKGFVDLMNSWIAIAQQQQQQQQQQQSDNST